MKGILAMPMAVARIPFILLKRWAGERCGGESTRWLTNPGAGRYVTDVDETPDTPRRGPFQPLDLSELGIEPQHVEIDTTTAHPARVYDYLLGGKDNYHPDRVVGDRLLAALPDVGELTRRNREFIHRAVRHLVAEQGIEQIIDVGTGIPTTPAVHEVARAVNPNVRIAYVDNDPIVLAHDRALLSHAPGVTTFIGDLLDPASVLDQPELRSLIDFTRPVAVLFAAVFHFVTDDQDPPGVVAAYRDRMAPGSAMVISHLSTSHRPAHAVREFVAGYTTSAPLVFRPDAAIADLFDGFTLADPGLVPLHDWRPDTAAPPETGATWATAGVGLRDS